MKVKIIIATALAALGFGIIMATTATASGLPPVAGSTAVVYGHTRALPHRTGCTPSAVDYSLNLNLTGANPPPYVKVSWPTGATTCGNLINAKGKFCVPNSGPCHYAYGLWVGVTGKQSSAFGTSLNYLKKAWAQMKNSSGSLKCRAELWPTRTGWSC